MVSDTEKTILRTLIFFDILDHPLTLFELWKYACVLEDSSVPSLSDCILILYNPLLLSEYSEHREGFYTLKGRGDSIRVRRERALFADRKYARAQRTTRMFARFPFVRMVCVCNTVGMGAAKEGSDIDFFIVARAHHLWLVRLLCTGYVHLLGKRPRGDRVRDTLCLSFYASDAALDFSSIAEQPIGETPDMYFLYWIVWCVPIYDDGVYEDFFQANTWVKRTVPNRIRFLPTPNRRVVLSRFEALLKSICEWMICSIGPWIEVCARRIQQGVMPPSITGKFGKGTGVIVSDDILKFHVSDRRRDIQEEFMKRCKDMGV